jgi:hypothetical protein
MRFALPAAGLFLAGTLLAACDGTSDRITVPPTPPPPPPDLSDLDLASAERCDHLVPEYCLFPFPNNHFTQTDAATETGLRIHLQPESMPAAQPVSIPPSQLAPAGVQTTEPTPIDPTEWNRNDGYSPGSMMLARVPGLDLEQTGAVRITDIARALDADAPILVIDAESGERQLIWAELDANTDDDDARALIIRPARNLVEGRRYIVALRDLRDAEGELIPATELFRAYRDDVDTEIEVFEQRRPAMNDLLARLDDHGVDRESLYLAWDFTVASQRNITERLLHVRDEAFASLGGGAPAFTVTQSGLAIEGSPRAGLSRGITGTFEVPNFLNEAGGPPGASFNYSDGSDPDALPSRFNGDGTMSARFRCQVPVTAVADFDDADAEVTPARAALYGHGLFGEGPAGETRGGAVRDMQTEHNIMFCATDWIGMSTQDFIAGIVHNLLADLGQLPRQLDRSQQGLVNAMFLAELLRHPDGFASHPAFRHGEDDVLVFVPDEVEYMGNSQGGILGGALVATAPNIDRGVLGVPGANYSLLLQRYGPFPERFGFIFYEAYPQPLDQQMGFALMQMLWDRAENNGYLSHLAGRHLPNTPTEKAVLLHVALGDHQVTHWSAEIMARTIGAAVHEPTVSLGEHPDSNPYFDIPLISYPHQGSALMVWDSGDFDIKAGRGTPFPPTNNTGPTAGDDPHSSPRNTVAARQQASDFMMPEVNVTDVCGDSPCFSDDYTGLSRSD